MTRTRALFFLTGVVFSVNVCAIQAQAPTPDETAVRQVVTTYLHGLKFNDIRDFKATFWPNALLLFTDRQGNLGQLTQEAWYGGFTASAGKEEAGTLRIAAIDVVRTIASVKVIEDYPTSRYIDFISLVKFGGEWKIVNKIYTSEKKP
jgi:putative lumazine-binding protein